MKRKILDTVFVLVAIAFTAYVGYGVKTDCEGTAGVYVKCDK
jgi:hypothetical protein